MKYVMIKILEKYKKYESCNACKKWHDCLMCLNMCQMLRRSYNVDVNIYICKVICIILIIYLIENIFSKAIMKFKNKSIINWVCLQFTVKQMLIHYW